MSEPSLAFVSELARDLGTADPVEAYYRPLTGQWEELTEEAGRLRAAAGTAARVSADLAEDLGRLDALWTGPDADAFVGYLGEIRSASEGAEDALEALAGALEELAGSVRRIVDATEEVIVDAADVLSESAMLPVGGANRARAQLRETGQSLQSLHSSAQDVLQEFGRLCDGVDAPPGQQQSIELRHHYPAEQFRLQATGTAFALPDANASASADSGTPSSDDSVTPSAVEQGKETAADPRAEPGQAAVPPAEPVAPPAPAQAESHGSGMPMMPMMGGFGGLGGGGGGDRPRKGRERFPAKPSEIFGEPDPVTPPVLGEDPAPEKARKRGKPRN
ncbi:WXG100 family type VII secretion target [Amycolatopsis jiangsuensis]|uniref:Uncharacterized protein YukE n=1 Tax=Amycolatopsis jiangsuensis TaxID=1181879 RepID=A0A840IZ03_9PSEU|nr:hypothetical protein [Amycolatopsis jiangsuensis]MBB4686432.1 uncharacterized protein YukE [Amycolatopsis jiangsuensis]